MLKTLINAYFIDVSVNVKDVKDDHLSSNFR